MTLETPPAQHLLPEKSGPSSTSRAPTPPTPPPRKKTHLLIRVLESLVFIAILLVGGWYGYRWLVGHNAAATQAAGGGKGGHGGGAIPVVTVQARRSDMPIHLTGLLGLVTPLNTVTVHTRVDGQIMTVAYKEGQDVKAGDLLVQIDPRPYQVQLAQAQGTLAKDQASLENARADLKRYQDAAEAVSRQQLDTAQATVDSDLGSIQTDQAAINSANLELTYCRVTAPISGRIGLRLVDEGNIVHAADTTGIAVITQLTPINVEFPVAQTELQAVLTATHGSTRPTDTVPVAAYNSDDTKIMARGKLSAIDSQIDPTSGMIKVKAEFPNTDAQLFPNEFVDIRVLVDTLKDVTVVDSSAIQLGPQGSFVWRVDDDNKATMVPVQTGPTEDQTTVITSGVTPGDTLVTSGVDRLEEGSKVVPHDAATQPGATETTSEATTGASSGPATTRGAHGGHRGHRSAS